MDPRDRDEAKCADDIHAVDDTVDTVGTADRVTVYQRLPEYVHIYIYDVSAAAPLSSKDLRPFECLVL